MRVTVPKVLYLIAFAVAVYGVALAPSHLWAALFVAIGTLAAGLVVS